MDGIRTPPQAIDAEQAVLDGLLLENDALDDFNVQLSPNDFYQHNHRLIYQHIEQLITLEQPADVIWRTVGSWKPLEALPILVP